MKIGELTMRSLSIARTRVQLQGLLGVLWVRGEGPVAGHQLGDEAEGPLSRQMRTTPLSIKRVRACVLKA